MSCVFKSFFICLSYPAEEISKSKRTLFVPQPFLKKVPPPPYDDYQILLFSPLELVLVADKERVEEMSVL